MLTHLQIRDFAIIESVELDLGSGFTALTGETGAGKSILIDALLLAVGGRGDAGAVRHGAERAEVTASFDVAGNAGALAWLEEQAIEHEGECVLRRTIGADGRGRAWINGQTIPAQSLRALGEHLLDVHGQMEYQSLTRRPYQREMLDDFGQLRGGLEAVRSAWMHWRELHERHEAWLQRARDRDARLELLSHYVTELKALDPAPGEAESLLVERRRIAALGKLAQGAAQLEGLLGADEGGAADALARAQSVVRPLCALDASLADTAQLVEDATIACREAVASVQRYAATLDADPSRQEWLESRLAAMEGLARKHRVEPAELPGLRDRLVQELDELEHAAEGLADSAQQLEAAQQRYVEAATRLSAARRKAAQALGGRVSELMQGLGMPGGVFEVRVESASPPRISEHGNDDIEFLVSANPGQPPRALSKVASGGELSRISLALQVATLGSRRRPCLIFDEVDAGVGGAVAEMVGQRLRSLASSGQVMCVTHLPQVAAQAQHQVRVSKQSDGRRTRTLLEPLEGEARVQEIARMLGGASITSRTLDHAREMLESAASASSSRGAGSSRARSGRARSASGR
jgi:DNA repair protein RecN (Recombination protein N)